MAMIVGIAEPPLPKPHCALHPAGHMHLPVVPGWETASAIHFPISNSRLLHKNSTYVLLWFCFEPFSQY